MNLGVFLLPFFFPFGIFSFVLLLVFLTVRNVGGAVSARPGSFSAPLDSSNSFPLTYMKYIHEGVPHYVPNYGFQPRVGDWDFVFSPTPRLASPKVNRTKERGCARRILEEKLYPTCSNLLQVVRISQEEALATILRHEGWLSELLFLKH